jgi:ABC-type sugar transport system ATPase subunit
VLDVALRSVHFRYPSGFALTDVSALFRRQTHTALLGRGSSTLLRLLEGSLRPASGDVVFGERRVNDLGPTRRPLLHATSDPGVPARWSVEHALVAAVRSRRLDREDRYSELTLAAKRWRLDTILGSRLRELSSDERARVLLARIELLRPGILLADRLLEGAAAESRLELADELHRILRVHGTTVVEAPSTRGELAFTDRVVVLEHGRILQEGTPAAVHVRPESLAAARMTGIADAVPVEVRGNEVDSAIGVWNVNPPPFQGYGIAVVRPWHFSPAAAGEESDLIFGIEEAGFAEGRWIARGLLSGGLSLRVELPAGMPIEKGRLLALRYQPERFTLLATDDRPSPRGVPTDVVPPMRETR